MANSPLRSPIDIGAVIANTYQLEALIGRGGMGSVFLACHLRLPGKQVAIKLLHEDVKDADVLARFRREAEIASRLGHPNIVAVHDFNQTSDGTPYLVLELLQGMTLATKIESGALSLEQTLQIVRQVGSALAAAHREGIVHRDLKPQNIFLVPTEIEGRRIEIAKVLDFGISKIRGSQTVKTQETSLLGTPQYMSPEQATGSHSEVDERTDVFALGSIVHEMITGKPAFVGASIPEVVFKVVYEQPTPLPAQTPVHIAAAIKQAMVKAMADRTPTVAAFVEALTGQPLTQLRPIAVDPPVTGFAAGSKHVRPDAHASTLASGDFPPVATGIDATLLPETPVPAASTAPTVSTFASPALAAPPARRAMWPLVALVVASIAATAIVMLVVLGGNERSGKRAAQRGDAPRPRTSVTTSETRPARTPPPDASVANIASPEVAVVATKPVITKQKPPVEKRSSVADPFYVERLDQASAAFRSGQGELGIKFAREVVNNAPSLAPRAYFMIGTHVCTTQDQETANSVYRALQGSNANLAKKLRAKCRHLID